MEHTHEYLHEHGIAHTHGEGHGHVHENTKAVLNRLARAIGHLESVKKMVEDGRDCSEVLIQLSAVRSAINNIGKVILEDHIQHGEQSHQEQFIFLRLQTKRFRQILGKFRTKQR